VVLARWEGPRRVFRELFVGWSGNFTLIQVAFFVWFLSTLCLAVGLATRLSAVVVWLLTLSFFNLNDMVNHGGDVVRNIVLFYLMLCPCGAAWSLDSLRLRRRGVLTGLVYVPAWPLRLLLIQLALMYCFAGLIKLLSPGWRNGDTIYYTLADLLYSRVSLAQVGLPVWLMRLMTWSVIFWETTFPLWLLLRWTRTAALLAGLGFHLGTLVLMELGGFEWSVLVLYLPLLPWGRWLRDPGFPALQPPAALPAPPGRQRLLGAFVVWQLLFLFVANAVSYVQYAGSRVPPQGTAVADEVAPGWAAGQGHVWDLLQKVRGVTNLWADLTEQPQFWRMYSDQIEASDVPVIEITYTVEAHPDQAVAVMGLAAPGSAAPLAPQVAVASWVALLDVDPPVYETVHYPSDHEPADHPIRFVGVRFSKVEQWVVPGLIDVEGESQERQNEVWASAIAEFVVGHQRLIRNFLAYRLRQAQAAYPDLPRQPGEVVLLARRYRINPPGSPAIWSEPRTVPVARWSPGVRDLTRSLEAYNPATGRFEALPAPEERPPAE
jgi:hypothetical protein